MNPRTRMRYSGLLVPAVTLVMLGAAGPPVTPPVPPPNAPIRIVNRTQADALPQALPDQGPGSQGRGVAPPSPSPLGTPLVPGQVIQPIDLPGALRLAGARDLDIGIARERVCQALAEL